jgi:LEA14-like dessication related protein
MWSTHRHALILAGVLVFGCRKPEPPEVIPKSIRVESVGPSGVGLRVELEVRNPNSFPLLVHDVDGVLALASGAELGRGHAEPNGSVPARGSAPMTSTLTIGFASVSALLPFALSGQPVPYRFRGTVGVGGDTLSVNLPFELSGELTQQQLLNAGLRGLSP